MLNLVRERCASSSNARGRLISTFISDSRWPGWQAIIGIETHAQIKSRTKLFSREYIIHRSYHANCLSLTSQDTKNTYDETPNTRVSLFDAAFPGTLPVCCFRPRHRLLLMLRM
jgi:aspartyl-tRNA(Asn)/glutamyl-tRNA(Gln) amidotransferase subunit B